MKYFSKYGDNMWQCMEYNMDNIGQNQILGDSEMHSFLCDWTGTYIKGVEFRRYVEGLYPGLVWPTSYSTLRTSCTWLYTKG